MATITRFEDLVIWQLGRKLTHEIYQWTKNECWQEDFKFRGQIRDSSGSVPDNIAEGFEREGNLEFINFLSIAKGSCGECRSQLYRAFDRNYCSAEDFEKYLSQTITLSVKIHNTMESTKQAEIKGYKFLRH